MSTFDGELLVKSLEDVHKQSHDTMHSYTRFGVVVKENSLKRERNTKCSGIVLGSARPSAAKAQLSLSLPPSPLLSLHPTKILDAPTHCAIPPPPLVYSLLLPTRLCSSALPRLKHWTAITRSVCNKRKSQFLTYLNTRNERTTFNTSCNPDQLTTKTPPFLPCTSPPPSRSALDKLVKCLPQLTLASNRSFT